MIFLIIPERSKWFLAEAESIDELIDGDPTFLAIAKQGKGCVVIQYNLENDELEHYLFPGEISDSEADDVADALQSNNWKNRPFTSAQVSALLEYFFGEDMEV